MRASVCYIHTLLCHIHKTYAFTHTRGQITIRVLPVLGGGVDEVAQTHAVVRGRNLVLARATTHCAHYWGVAHDTWRHLQTKKQ